MSEASQIFDDMADELDIPFAFPTDGCYARADAMIERMSERYYIEIDAIEKVFAQGSLQVETEYNYVTVGMTSFDGMPLNDDTVEWGWHVAPLLDVKLANGAIQQMVIDPALFDQPVTIDMWAAEMGVTRESTRVASRHEYAPGWFPSEEEAALFTRIKMQQYHTLCSEAGYCEPVPNAIWFTDYALPQ
jgi:hypothetical protein